MKKSLVIVGASRGIGNALAQHFESQGENIFSVSRSPSESGTWIQADISTPEGISEVISTVADTPIDALLFMGGIWEKGA
ncbi:MAG: SDR family NAD(P)-dependent oxidoreductase, partial [Verrucomicrobiota bacterium]